MPGLLDRFMGPDKAARAAQDATATPPATTPPASAEPAPKPAAKPEDFKSLDSFLSVVQSSQQASGDGDDNAVFDLAALAGNDEAINAVTSKLNFIGTLPEDVRAKLKEGDADAFIQALEHIGKASYATAFRHAAIVADRALKSQTAVVPKTIKAALKRELEARDLDSSLPAQAHSTTKAVLKSVADSIRTAHPELSAAESMNAAQNMLSSVVDNMTGRTDNAGSPVTPKGKVNWDTWAKG